MSDYKNILGMLSVFVGLLGSFPYIRDTLNNKTKPHAISWFVWFFLSGIAFTAQILRQGGAGSWLSAYACLYCLFIFILALRNNQKSFVLLDWISLVGSVVALFVWWLTKDPTGSVILITIIYMCGYIPTIHKGFYQPYEETIISWALGSVEFAFSLLALGSYSIVTGLYPFAGLIANGLLALMLIIRRNQLYKT
ncbi:MAG: hypothetical protein JWM56_593 [Candidatus Peribacteria bacterium]|nr:hypothetical protein [Candidatus Peribacteria bacterium]